MNRRSFLKTVGALMGGGVAVATGCVSAPEKEESVPSYCIEPVPVSAESHERHLALHRDVIYELNPNSSAISNLLKNSRPCPDDVKWYNIEDPLEPVSYVQIWEYES